MISEGAGKDPSATSAAAEPQAEAAVIDKKKKTKCQMYAQGWPGRSSLQPTAAPERPSQSMLRSPSSSLVSFVVPPKLGGATVVTKPSVTDADTAVLATFFPPPT